MATSFPGSLDAFTNPIASDTLDNPPHDEQHADINDAMEAVQAKLGVDGSAVPTSLDYKLNTIGTYQSFTTTATNITISTQDCYYAQINDLVVVNYFVRFAGAATGIIELSLPVAAAFTATANTRTGSYGNGLIVDASTGLSYICWPRLASATTIDMYSMDWASGFSAADSNTPMAAWQVNDSIRINFIYGTVL